MIQCVNPFLVSIAGISSSFDGEIAAPRPPLNRYTSYHLEMHRDDVSFDKETHDDDAEDEFNYQV
jgi:hypothetical protein